MSEANRAVALEFQNIVSRHYLSALDRVIAPTMQMHDPASPPMPTPGPEGMRAFFGMYITAFPDIKSEEIHAVAEGDRVCLHWRCTGTNTGPLGPMPATGKKVDFQGMEVHRIADGKIQDTWVTWDKVGMLQQLGVMPA